MQRRHFLHTALHTGAAAALGLPGVQLHAATGPATGAPRFLMVFLRGGMDAASLLPPVSSSFYYEVRPDIAIAKPDADLTSALPLTADWGLHPALRDTLYPLYQQGELAFVPYSGTDNLSRSHFETQDSIELGQQNHSSTAYGSGFLNRLAKQLQGRPAVTSPAPMAFTDQLPIALQGELRVPNTSLRNLTKPSVDTRQSRIIAAMYQGTALEGTVQSGFAVREQVMREMSAEMDAASRGAITAKGFELEARRIARLMREQYALGFVDVGGWDTHVAQGGATGYLASRLDELGQGLAAFSQEMGSAWRNTVVVVMSEFGRTFRQNGNRGTDHGHGSVMWVLGRAVRGKQVVGEQVQMTAATLFQNRDYAVLNEYRSVLGGIFKRQWGLSDSQLSTVFPGFKGARDWGLV
ncbi:DUF1501 domain-containing protein [Rhodoferax sp. TBRC 17660]|uniref:DUF1501 domain-containing protein n=1 Tax=Rhodoferax potami TaxID=3068338 RepID=A0ABU3KPR5_9BURK|nr:DUF1501 domain-containing protein [Rhodoferax sp. TBRC 17660]MDT7519239.1 DUF1501 domain-containing protein [Rhodoferax sp. TBRC 17660]